MDTSKCTILNKGTKQVLIINNLHAEDEDEYTCRATNSLGSRSTRAQLKISTKPKVMVPPRYNLGVEIDHGMSVELKVPYKAYPAGTATWLKNDLEKIENSSKYSITTDDKLALHNYCKRIIAKV